ncbi:MAG TPA: GNAT family N-acetyltransferase [Chloroflexota bacterium]|jgi:GNAT superfamily N-acetyltransferase|nr:GNAT family N-acetyltransferase [Chloroflexota bacterium]
MEIRRAVPAEAPELQALMIASKRYWGYTDEWMAAWISRQSLTAQYFVDHAGEVYVAVAEATLAGFYALLPQGPLCILDDLWVARARIGTGIGRQLFAHALRRASELGAGRMEWEAEPNAAGFYLRMGAQQIGETTSRSGRVLPVMAIAVALVTAPDVPDAPPKPGDHATH